MGWLRDLFNPKPAPPGCMACESADLEWLGPDVYRCRMCAHEGGDGLPAYAKQRASAAIQALDPAARRALAERSLSQARPILIGVQIDVLGLDPMHVASDAMFRLAAGGGTSDAAEARERAVLNAVQELAEAERLLVEASQALGRGHDMTHSINETPTQQFFQSGVLQNYRKGLLEVHSSLEKLLG